MNLSAEQQRIFLKAEAQRRVNCAMQAIERAQIELGNATQILSALQHGAPCWRATSKMYDRVHALWYRVQRLKHNSRVALDPLNTQAALDGLSKLKGAA